MATAGFSRGLWVSLVCACTPTNVIDPTQTTGETTGETGETSGDLPTGDLPTGDGTTGVEGPGVAIASNHEVDLLFVVDNSGSMAVAQTRLSQAIGTLLAALEAPDVRADYRIGVTTTDSGNPRCPSAQYQPEGGNLVLSSCLDRVEQGEFTFNSEDFSAACTDFCSKRDSDLSVLGTATAVDPTKLPRKWVERSAGVLNIGGAEAVEALQCYLPQGVAGCGLESHLESMYLALASASSKNSKNNYGFLRDAAQLAVVFVSDETDCSYNPAAKEIFTSNKVFWNSPDDPGPTSAMCWRAGVACTGGPGTYSECHAENYDLQGSEGVADADAVLHPVSKYIDFVQSIEQQKQQFDTNLRVKVSLMTGVPAGYDRFDAEIEYEDAADPDYQANFGIGPGCVGVGPNQEPAGAVPPVREREFAEAFVDDPSATRRLYSLCDGDFSAALQAIGGEIADSLVPACMPSCVADTDSVTPVLEPSCTLVEENLIEGTQVEVGPCQVVNGAWVPGDGATVCFAYRVDKTGNETPSELDNMSKFCVDEGFNLEFNIVRVVPAAPGAVISASCALSKDKTQDCPKL